MTALPGRQFCSGTWYARSGVAHAPVLRRFPFCRREPVYAPPPVHNLRPLVLCEL